MFRPWCHSITLSFMILLSAICMQPARAASDLVVSPSVVKPDYLGDLVLTAKIDPGSTVRIDLIPDFNKDGEADAAEIAAKFQSVLVEDNQQFKVDGEVYPHVPGDSDSRSGWLEVRFPLNNDNFYRGSYLYRIDDGEGTDTAGVTYALNTYPLEIQGTVYQDGDTETGIPSYVLIELDEDYVDFDALIPTDTEGNFQAYLPVAATYAVLALMPGKITSIEDGGGLPVYCKAGTTGPVSLNLVSNPNRLHTISGQVRDKSRNGIPYAFVVAIPQSEGDDGGFPCSITTSDADGRYSLPVVDGSYRIQSDFLALRGFVENDQGIDSLEVVIDGDDEGGKNITASEPITALIKGRLLDGSTPEPHKPIKGAIIPEAFLLDDNHDDTFYSEHGIDSEGRFMLGVFEENWYLEIDESTILSASGLILPQRQMVDINDGEVIDLGDIVLEPAAGTIAVTVLDDSQTPMPGIGVYFNYENDGGHANSGWLETGADGKALYPVPVAGSYYVGAGYQDYEENPFLISPPGEIIEVATGETKYKTIVMTMGGLIEGTVQADGQPIAVGEVRVLPATTTSVYDWVDGRWLYNINDRPDGLDYWIPVPPGQYKVYASELKDDWNDHFGYTPQFANEKYAFDLADTVTVPAVGTRTRVDFNVERGAKLQGFCYAQLSEQQTYAAGGVRVDALDSSSFELKSTVEARWGDGLYSFHIPEGNYLLRIRPQYGTYFFHTTYYDQVLTSEQATEVTLTTGDEETIDLYVDAIIRTIGDINLNGQVDGKDLFLFSSVWGAENDQSEIGLLSDLKLDDMDIDEEDLLELIKLWGWR